MSVNFYHERDSRPKVDIAAKYPDNQAVNHRYRRISRPALELREVKQPG